MQDVFYEECAKIQNEKTSKNKYYFIKTFSVISYVLAVVWVIIVFYGFDFSGEGLLLKIIFVLLPLVMFILSGIFIGRIKDKMYVDYDYTFVSGSIRFSRVIKNIKRKTK